MPPNRFCHVVRRFSSGSYGPLAGVAHLSTLESRVPFINFFDGFRTSHEFQKIEVMDKEDIAPLVARKALAEFRRRALTPEHPVARGMAENPEHFFDHRELCNSYYDAVPAIVEKYMAEISKITGREYELFSYYGADDAERVIICYGFCNRSCPRSHRLPHRQRRKGGYGHRTPVPSVLSEAPPRCSAQDCKKIAVLDRTKEPGANGEPLYLDVKDASTDRKTLRLS